MAAPKLKLDEIQRLMTGADEATAKKILTELYSFPNSYPESDSRVWVIRAYCYSLLREAQNAFDALHKAYDLCPTDLNKALLGAFLLFMGNEEVKQEGLTILTDLVHAHTLAHPAYMMTVSYYWDNQKWIEACKVIEEAYSVRQLAPHYPEYLMMASYSIMKCGDVKQAKELLLEALGIILKKEIRSLSEVNLAGALSIIDRQIFWPASKMAKSEYVTSVSEWFEGQRKSRKDQLRSLKNRYDSRIKAQVDEVNHTEAAMRISLEALEDMNPYRTEANSAGL